MTRFAVAFTTEKGQPVGRPMWVAKGARKTVDFGSYVGPSWMVTDQPEQAMTWAKATTAADWARTLTGSMPEVRSYTAVEAPHPCPACGTYVVNDGGVAFEIDTTPHSCPEGSS